MQKKYRVVGEQDSRLRSTGIVCERHGVARNVVEALVAEGVLVVEEAGRWIPEQRGQV